MQEWKHPVLVKLLLVVTESKPAQFKMNTVQNKDFISFLNFSFNYIGHETKKHLWIFVISCKKALASSSSISYFHQKTSFFTHAKKNSCLRSFSMCQYMQIYYQLTAIWKGLKIATHLALGGAGGLKRRYCRRSHVILPTCLCCGVFYASHCYCGLVVAVVGRVVLDVIFWWFIIIVLIKCLLFFKVMIIAFKCFLTW